MWDLPGWLWRERWVFRSGSLCTGAPFKGVGGRVVLKSLFCQMGIINYPFQNTKWMKWAKRCSALYNSAWSYKFKKWLLPSFHNHHNGPTTTSSVLGTFLSIWMRNYWIPTKAKPAAGHLWNSSVFLALQVHSQPPARSLQPSLSALTLYNVTDTASTQSIFNSSWNDTLKRQWGHFIPIPKFY